MKYKKKFNFKILLKYFYPINYIKYFFRISFFLTNINIFHGKLPSFCTDGIVTSHIFGGFLDLGFQKSIKDTQKEISRPIYALWRYYTSSMILKMLMQKKSITYVECGVGEGITLKVFVNYIKNLGLKNLDNNLKKSNFLLMDTFNGIDINLISEDDNKEYITKPYGGATLSVIKKRFNFLKKKIKIIKGSIPGTLKQVTKKFMYPDFLHIDLNNPVPEVSTIHFFLKKMKPGSIILLDDYAFANSSSQRESIDLYFDKLKLSRPLTLPTGQGIYFF